MDELERIYEQAIEAKRSGLPPLGLAPFLPMVEESLGVALSHLPEEQRVTALQDFRDHLAAPVPKDFRPAVSSCRRCPRLRRPVVVGEGRYNRPRVALYGEAPGSEEHAQNRPFIGPAGQLLRRVLAEATLDENEIWISNTVRCYPPGEGNRSFGKPSGEEVENCRRWMVAEIETCAPKLIVLLGNYALKAIFPKAQITSVRGEVRRIGTYLFLPTFHPSAVLRDMRKIDKLENDMSLAARLTKGE